MIDFFGIERAIAIGIKKQFKMLQYQADGQLNSVLLHCCFWSLGMRVGAFSPRLLLSCEGINLN